MVNGNYYFTQFLEWKRRVFYTISRGHFIENHWK